MNRKSQEPREKTLRLHKFPEDMSHVYVEIHPGHIAAWEHGLRAYPDAEWNYNKISDILPFVKAVKPRIGLIQTMSGLSLISLDKFYHGEEHIIRYGLEPLEKAQILGEPELAQVAKWYRQTQTANHGRGFEKRFDISGKQYKLETNLYQNSRHLNLKVLE